MIELRQNELIVRAPGVHKLAECSIQFQRTLRIPDDNREYPLPAGLGAFPIFHVDDYADSVPEPWIQHGGVFLPMYQSEALWINFDGFGGYPFAIKIAAGKINAVSGEAWRNGLTQDPQDYVVVPEQPWLDGFSISNGLIRQFVAMPLGEGYTAEGQVTGREEYGGLQFAIYPMKADYYESARRCHAPGDLRRPLWHRCMGYGCDVALLCAHHQQRDVSGHYRHTAADQADLGKTVRNGGHAVVRLLERRAHVAERLEDPGPAG
jgi:hypothetical protein